MDELKKIVEERNVIEDERLDDYSSDSTFLRCRPEVVVRPGNTGEVAEVVKFFASKGMPMTTRGGGTGLSGGAVAMQGAVIALDRLRSLEMHPATLTASAGAGVISAEVSREALHHGLFYPPDPASIEICTIGGNIATNAGGPSCLKYGVTAEYVMGLTVVLADGRVLKLGGHARKRSAGYRLMQLFVGSEGTLGIVTEAILRLVPSPAARGCVLVSFNSSHDAARAVAAILGGGHLPCACEIVDRTSLAIVGDLLPEEVDKQSECILIIEQDGPNEVVVHDELKEILAIAVSRGANDQILEMSGEGRTRLWLARRSIGQRLVEKRADRLPEDICVPIDKIPEMTSFIRAVGSRTGLSIALFGHAGDGNLHPSLIFDGSSDNERGKAALAVGEIFREAIRLGGSVSAEHGLGAVKREFAELELGQDAVEIMKGLKKLLDPHGLLNPGKVFPQGGVLDETLYDSLPGWCR